MVGIILAVWFLFVFILYIRIMSMLDDIKYELEVVELRLKHDKEDIVLLSKHHAELQLLTIKAINAESQMEQNNEHNNQI